MQFIFLVFRTPPSTTSREDLRVVLNGVYVPLFFFSLFQISGVLTLTFLHQSGTIQCTKKLFTSNLHPNRYVIFLRHRYVGAT